MASYIGRRKFLATLLGGAATWPLAASAQQSAMPVVGYLSARSAASDVPMLDPFRRGLNEAGYVEGQNLTIEYRWAGGQSARLPALAEDLVRRQVAVIVAAGGEPAALAAKAATGKISIVFNVGDDPVRVGLVASLNRPGGNATGVSSLLGAQAAKQFGLLCDLVPKAAVIVMLVDLNFPYAGSQISNTEAAARANGRQLVVLTAGSERDLDAAFATLAEQQVGAMLVTASSFFTDRRGYLVALVARHALPTIYFRREFADAGGLISYGSSTAEQYGQMGVYVGKILNGAKPADLPVLQSARFELVINLKTAKTLGLEIPPGILSIADEVIE
jgi:putative tryptophan/tyrosine transport system substrate-binding protein